MNTSNPMLIVYLVGFAAISLYFVAALILSRWNINIIPPLPREIRYLTDLDYKALYKDLRAANFIGFLEELFLMNKKAGE